MEIEKHFSLKTDLIDAVSELTDKKAGLLFKHILFYVNHKDHVSDDAIVNFAFVSIKADLEKTMSISSKRREAGKHSALSRTKSEEKETKLNKIEQNPTKVNKSEQNEVLLNPKLDYQKIISIFNEVCADLPKARLTDNRIKLIDKILVKYTLEDIGQVFQNTRSSNYLSGKIKDWRANFDWLLNPKNFIKVLEGNYDKLNVPANESESIQSQWEEANNAVDKYYK